MVQTLGFFILDHPLYLMEDFGNFIDILVDM